jgi:hypothetical protein
VAKRRPMSAKIRFTLPLFVVTACGGTSIVNPGPELSSTIAGKVGFTVSADRPVEKSNQGASYTREVSVTPVAQGVCTSTNVGSCSINPCYSPASPASSPSSPLPDVGRASIFGAQMTAMSMMPERDGTYNPAVLEGVPWTTSGETVSFQWANFPGLASVPGDTITLASPPYVALVSSSAFFAANTTVTRSSDLTVAWSSDSVPAAIDELAVDVTSGSTQLVCTFSVSAGQGVIPSAALQNLGAGVGTYNVHAKEYTSRSLSAPDGSAWDFDFNVDATARAPYGLAKGSVTLQ